MDKQLIGQRYSFEDNFDFKVNIKKNVGFIKLSEETFLSDKKLEQL